MSTDDRDSARTSPLAMDPSTFRAAGHALIDQLADRLAAVPTRPVTPNESPSAVRQALGLDESLPEHGTPSETLLAEATTRLFEHSLFNGHPRFFGYITSSPAPIGMLADLLAAAVNPNVGSWMLAPAATEIERQTVRWIAELIGFSPASDGLLVSGGNMANMVCFWAARAAKTPWNVRELGLGGAPRPLRVYASAETHTWIQKAADLCGLGTSAIRWIDTDASLRMRVDVLRRQIEADMANGDVPLLVVGTAGSVSTGAVDPLADIAALCRLTGAWFHVDGAYGAFAAAVPEASRDLRGLALADSVACDPHKWLYAPLEAGCALVRDPGGLRAAFAYHPAYYHFDERVTNYVDFGPQNSRGFRALKVWLALRHAGAAGYRAMIARDIRLAERLAEAVGRHAELELGPRGLSITTFRYVPWNLRARVGFPDVEQHLDRLNRALLDRLQRGGELFVSNAVVRGRYLLRACIVNFNTTAGDIDAVPEITARIGADIDRELRGLDATRPAG